MHNTTKCDYEIHPPWAVDLNSAKLVVMFEEVVFDMNIHGQQTKISCQNNHINIQASFTVSITFIVLYNKCPCIKTVKFTDRENKVI